jgi:hypothetical protein
MMRYSSKLKVLIFVATAFSVLKSSAESAVSGWPFRVGPDGGAALTIPLFRTNNPPEYPLSLRHTLVFDGISFRSVFHLVGAVSCIYPSGEKSFRWLCLDGSTKTLKIGVNAGTPGELWSLRVVKPGCAEVSSADGSASFVYENGEISSATQNGHTIVFLRTKEEVIIQERVPHAGTIAKICISPSGLPETAEISGTWRYTFRYTQQNQLSTVILRGDRVQVTNLTYVDGLLVGVRSATGRLTFSWGRPSWGLYSKPLLPLPPVIVYDGRYNYEYHLTQAALTVTVEERGKPVADWISDTRTRSHTITWAR